MGFFFDAPVKAEGPARASKAPGGAKAQRKTILNGARGCDACALQGSWATMSTPRMPLKGAADASILILGGAPSKEADLEGVPFSAKGDRLLLDLLPSRDRDLLAFQHAARCLPFRGNPDLQTMHACSIHLEADIERHSKLRYIIGVGASPLQRFMPGHTIHRVHGVPMPVRLAGRDLWYFPVLDPAYVQEMGGMRTAAGAALRADLNRFFRDRRSWGKPVVREMSASQVLLPSTYEEAKALVDKMRGPLGIDIETSKLKPYEKGARLLTGAISDDELTIAFPVDHPEQQSAWGLRLLLETVRTRPWLAHNASFELVWLRWHADSDAPFQRCDDSQAQARIYYERETIASLETVSLAALGTDPKGVTGVNAARIMEYPLAEVLPYNGLDARASALIDRAIGARVRGENYDRILGAVYTTAMMELKGLPIDYNAALALKAEWGEVGRDGKQSTGKILETEIKASRLFEVRQFEITRQKDFRLAANEDVGTALVEFGRLHLPKLSKPGTYKTDDETLAAATKDSPHPLVGLVLDYRQASKHSSTYIDPILEVPDRYTDGLLHPSYSAILTATLRLSSSDPNIQNFPKRKHKEFRTQIVPPKGHLVCAVDYGQLEARVVGMASRDQALCSSIISGEDIHSYWRDYILERYPEYWTRMAEMSASDPDDKAKVLKGGRNLIKTDFVFASFFGASVDACATRTGVPLSTMRDVQSFFWQRYHSVQAWHRRQRQEYNDLALVRTLTGRVRRGILWGNEPINTPIQGSAADIVIESMNAIAQVAEELKEPALFPRINIHDDLTFFLPDTCEDELAAYIDIICKTLTEVRHPWQIIPLTVEVSIGTNWADPEEVLVYTGDYVR